MSKNDRIEEILNHLVNQCGYQEEMTEISFCMECGFDTNAQAERTPGEGEHQVGQVRICSNCGLVLWYDEMLGRERVMTDEEWEFYKVKCHPSDWEIAKELGITLHYIPNLSSERN